MSEYIIMFITTFLQAFSTFAVVGIAFAIVWGVTMWVADTFGDVVGVITFITILTALLAVIATVGEMLGGGAL